MAESLSIPSGLSRREKYALLEPGLRALTHGETDLTANLANITAALKESFGFLWTGFYRVDGDELVLGPFQGPVACTRITFGKGVCGAAWKEKRTIVVPDVDQFPGHIACSSLSRSEIVVPVIRNGTVVMVLDVDSSEPGHFGDDDIRGLEMVARIVADIMP